MAKVVEHLVDRVVIRIDEHTLLIAQEFDIQSLLLQRLLKGNQNDPSHLTNIKRTHRKFAISRLNAGQIQKRRHKS